MVGHVACAFLHGFQAVAQFVDFRFDGRVGVFATGHAGDVGFDARLEGADGFEGFVQKGILQIGADSEILTMRGKRLQERAGLPIQALTLRSPTVGMHSIWHEEECQAGGRHGSGSGCTGRARGQTFQE